MLKKAKKQLFERLFIPYLGITVVAVVVVGLYGSYVAKQFYLEQTAEDLEARARLCAKEIADYLDRGETDAIDAHCKDWGNAIDTRITVILPTGEVLGDTDEDPQEMENHKSRPEIAEAIRSGLGQATRYSGTTKEDRMYLAVSARTNGVAAVVRTSIPVTAIDKTLKVVYEQIIIVALLATGVIGAVSFWIWLRISRSLHTMVAAADRFAQGDLAYRLPDSDSESEEISELAEAMNRMAEQLNERIQAARREQKPP